MRRNLEDAMLWNGSLVWRAEHGSEGCSTTAIRALGGRPEGDRARTVGEISRELRNSGLKVEEIPLFRKCLSELPTLGRFCADHPEGSFLVCTERHAMALVDSELTDTECGGPRRRVQFAYRVEAQAMTDLKDLAKEWRRQASELRDDAEAHSPSFSSTLDLRTANTLDDCAEELEAALRREAGS